MARRVFFSFHYERDIWRANQVRNSWVTKEGIEEAGFIDHASWEKVERQGEDAIKRWIDSQLKGASVTVVLIGSETANRKWVNYEIVESHNQRMGLLGVYIHNVKDILGRTASMGANPFGELVIRGAGTKLSTMYTTFDWVNDNGYKNLGVWIEKVAKAAGR